MTGVLPIFIVGIWIGRSGVTGTRHAVRRNPRRQETTVHGDNAPCVQASELQASLARGIGQRLDAAVVAVAGTVEGNLLDARRSGLLRSEEHTSELQSLMRISYAVFC